MDAFNFIELDEETRGFMTEELDRDIALNGAPYISQTSLTPKGRSEYVDLLREAIASGSEVSLINALNQDGRVTSARSDTARRLGSSEFNRYYLRGVCRRARAHGVDEVVIYRGRASKSERPSSREQIGQERSATRALDDLRTGVTDPGGTAVGLVYSGLTFRCGCESCMAVAHG